MALGSSAPEIILNVADTLGSLGEIPSELGPQTIVGSASFNFYLSSSLYGYPVYSAIFAEISTILS